MTHGKKLKPVHPGEVLAEEFLGHMGISQNRLALDIRVPARRINEIVHGKRAVTPDTALRLGMYFAVSPEFWLNLQMHYDLEVQGDKIDKQLKLEIRIFAVDRKAHPSKK